MIYGENTIKYSINMPKFMVYGWVYHMISGGQPPITINIGQKGGLIGHASITQTPITLNFG